MAQHFYGPYQDSDSLFTAHTDSAAYSSSAAHPSYPQPQLNAPSIKDEFYTFDSLGQETDITQPGRPNKRQKTVEGGSNHKFVSQKKWKFSEGQPWLPSKLSSKAQNASRMGKVTKAESASPGLPSPPPVSLPVRSFEEPTSYTSLNNNLPNTSQPAPERQERANAKTSHSAELSTRTAKRPVAITRTLTNQPAAAVGVSRSATAERQVEKDLVQQKGRESARRPSKPADTPPSEATRPILSKSRSSRSIQALSLQRDGEQIAALIEEKKKENEATMFRERMFRRQQELKNQKEACHSGPGESSVPARAPSEPIATIQNTRADSDESQLPSPTRESITMTVARSSRSPTKVTQRPALPRLQNPSTRSRTVINRTEEQIGAKESEPVASRVQKSPRICVTSQVGQFSPLDHQDILFGTRGGYQPSAGKQQLRSAALAKNPNTPHPPAKGSAPFEIEDADITAQLVDFTNQLLIKRPAQNTHTSHVPSNQVSLAQHYQRQVMSPLPTTQPQVPLRSNSGTPLAGFNTMERASSSLASPTTPTYSHSPTSISSQQFSNMDLSSSQPLHSQPAAMMYHTGPMRSRPASMGSMPNHSAYYAPEQYRWAVSDQHASHAAMKSTVMPPVQQSREDFSIPASSQTNTARYAQHQQQQRHSGMLSATENPPNSNARNDPGSASGAVAAKPRVNMFSNTKGTPFPMHEVIRQIEMT